jgi:hypothetical protein
MLSCNWLKIISTELKMHYHMGLRFQYGTMYSRTNFSFSVEINYTYWQQLVKPHKLLQSVTNIANKYCNNSSIVLYWQLPNEFVKLGTIKPDYKRKPKYTNNK